jgi:hypothetical protein
MQQFDECRGKEGRKTERNQGVESHVLVYDNLLCGISPHPTTRKFKPCCRYEIILQTQATTSSTFVEGGKKERNQEVKRNVLVCYNAITGYLPSIAYLLPCIILYYLQKAS